MANYDKMCEVAHELESISNELYNEWFTEENDNSFTWLMMEGWTEESGAFESAVKNARDKIRKAKNRKKKNGNVNTLLQKYKNNLRALESNLQEAKDRNEPIQNIVNSSLILQAVELNKNMITDLESLLKS